MQNATDKIVTYQEISINCSLLIMIPSVSPNILSQINSMITVKLRNGRLVKVKDMII